MQKNYYLMRSTRLWDMQHGHSRSLNLLNQEIGESYSKKYIEEINSILHLTLEFCTESIGLGSSQYVAHPIRVAHLVHLYQKPQKSFFNIKLALIHNILEVSSLNFYQAEKLFGLEIIEDVKTLTIDKKKRWDKKYLDIYYNKINISNHRLKLIKCCDKLDNLFLLEDNESVEEKKLYLEEINNYVLPLASQVNDDFYSYFLSIFKETFKIISEQENRLQTNQS